MAIYTAPSYAMGSADTPSDKQRAEAALRQMQRSLRGWLTYRRRMDAYVVGKIVPPVLFRRAKPLPPSAVAATLRRDRYRGEQDLADTLHALLVETGCPAEALPLPNVANDPDAAVKLAEIALAGKCPSEMPVMQATGIIWLLAIPIAGAVLVISQMIKSKADVEKERERLRCIEAGACTDSGFWLKVGAIAVTGWLAWDKFGLREAVEKRTKKRV